MTGLPISKEDPETFAKKKRTYNRVLETTLVDFETIRVKDLAQNLNIDPLFKKALADFDEGGAKSLLINTLEVDDNLRVVFDATTKDTEQELEINKEALKETTEQLESNSLPELRTENSSMESDDDQDQKETHDDITPETSLSGNKDSTMLDIEDDILDLGMKLFDFGSIETLAICPSMDQLQSAVADMEKAKSFVEGVNEKSENFLSERDLQTLPEIDDDAAFDYEEPPQDENEDLFEENEGMNNYSNVGDHPDMGQNSLQNNIPNASKTIDEDKSYADTMSNVLNNDLLAYFDTAMEKNWRGREHWKVCNIKAKLNKSTESSNQHQEHGSGYDKQPADKKVQKPQFEIDFFELNDELEDQIFASKKGSLELPVKQRTNPTHYLLPNDYKFSTDRITKLFIKPQQNMSFFSHRNQGTDRIPGSLKFDDTEIKEVSNIPEIADEHFWAENYRLNEQEQEQDLESSKLDKSLNPSFEEDNGIDFNQAFEDEDLDVDIKEDFNSTQGLLSNNRVTYSRTSKKVDVRKLKNNIWKSISNRLHVLKDEEDGHVDTMHEEQAQEKQDTSLRSTSAQPENFDLNFTDVAHDIVSMYSSGTRKDLSTSFCFICLLHLANEYGFDINEKNDYTDLQIHFPEKIANTIVNGQ